MAQKKKRRGRGKTILIIVLTLFVLAMLALIYGYIDFEFKKIGESGITPLSDWRSYLAYLMNKVPIINQYVEYQPRQVIKPSTYYTEIYESYIEKIEKDRIEIEERFKELEMKENDMKSFQAELNAKKQELDLKEEKLETEITSWQDRQTRLEQLADWFSNSDVQNIATAIASQEISVEEIVNALRLVEPGIAADIVGNLALTDQDKAGQILARLAGKEVTK